MLDSNVVRHFGLSLILLSLLVTCCEFSVEPKNFEGALKWASTTVMVSACYVVFLRAFARMCNYPRLNYRPPSDSMEEDTPRIMPFLNEETVWVYVYGWGLFLFVSLFCVSGLNLTCSCVWMISLILSVVDDLLTGGASKWFTAGFCLLLAGGVVLLDLNSMNDPKEETVVISEDKAFAEVWVDVILPVMLSFFFLTVKTVTLNSHVDAREILKMAFPFMVVLAVCYLMSTVDTPNTHHNFQQNFTETMAEYDPYRRPSGTKVASLLLSPIIAFLTLDQMITSLVNGFSAEFLSAMLLVLNARYWFKHDDGLGLLNLGIAGLCEALIVVARRA